MMKFTALTFAALACTSYTAEASLRRVMRVVDAQETAQQRNFALAFEREVLAQPTYGQNKKVVTPDVMHNRALSNAPRICHVDNYSCTPDASCECPEGYTVKENLIPEMESGCYQCSKDDGDACTTDAECQWGISACYDSVCAPKQCTNHAEIEMIGSYQGTKNSCSYDCSCNLGGYTVKEEINPERLPGCYHCSKPAGATCQDDHECELGMDCVDGKCGVALCEDSKVGAYNYCSKEDKGECQCVAPYSVKEDLGNEEDGACFHCSKPVGEVCEKDHECEQGNKCIDGACAVPVVSCPTFPTCTYNADCVCEDATYPNLYTHTFENGVPCYACKA